MKRKLLSFAAVLAVALLGLGLIPASGGEAKAAGGTYYLTDSFGAAPAARTLSENMERVRLSATHKPYTKYGYGARLTDGAQGREYITYDVRGVNKIEVTGIAVQSVFAANHGWGVSLGVTDDAASMPLNNVTNIDLEQLYPIYLDENGRPFIFFQNQWFCYIAGGEKYSFAPSALDIKNQLRPFTVPEEVKGFYEQKVDDNGEPVFGGDGKPVMIFKEKGYRYPMLSAEYGVREQDGSVTWHSMVLDSARYSITAAEFIGGDKEYSQTVEIRNIPAADMVRIGVNYIRETLKPSAAGDTETDVFEPFAKAADESIYVTNVKLTMSEPYEGGFEELTKTGIAADLTGATRIFAFGEAFSAEGVRLLDVFDNGIEETSQAAYTVDSSAFDPYAAGIYSVRLTSGEDSTSYNVEVLPPDSIKLDTSAATLTFGSKEEFTAEGINVTAVTNLGTTVKPDIRETEVPADKWTADISGVDFTKDGTYTVTITVGSGSDAVTAEYGVTVARQKKGCGAVIAPVSVGGGAAGIVIVSLLGAALFAAGLRRKHAY